MFWVFVHSILISTYREMCWIYEPTIIYNIINIKNFRESNNYFTSPGSSNPTSSDFILESFSNSDFSLQSLDNVIFCDLWRILNLHFNQSVWYLISFSLKSLKKKHMFVIKLSIFIKVFRVILGNGWLMGIIDLLHSK